MNVAREMFVRDGYEAVTLRSIALAIEYTPGFVYKLFKDKQSLVREIIRRDSDDLRIHLLECLKVGNPVRQLVEMARLYGEWAVTHPNHYRLMLVPPPAWVEQNRELHRQKRIPLEQEALSVLTVLVKEAIGLLKAKYAEPALVAATLWAGIHGVALLEITMTPKDRALLGGKDTTFEARFKTLCDVFLDGFLNDRPE
ncbi:MAG TPA: TetR/AcrR family transcriptional regulator [Candidatus Hydrogenedentes bacterium]|nr:TetR/AcrR family transcriptional regulator [Candidatus Hydrogenedentota bacterium]HRT20220.1 TetR/AcrR family transcriptional regulator [Candidatus Hydrogenedentota bacterium]HRT64282.1 TetR/AcrR family transcriptional regulator [Candidatus Hydrogenedentota bacterium]